MDEPIYCNITREMMGLIYLAIKDAAVTMEKNGNKNTCVLNYCMDYLEKFIGE